MFFIAVSISPGLSWMWNIGFRAEDSCLEEQQSSTWLLRDSVLVEFTQVSGFVYKDNHEFA